MFRSIAIVFILTVAITSFAQDRKYTVGTTIDLVGGGANRLNSLSSSTQQTLPFFFYYGAYPSISLLSTGARSRVDGSYAFGINRTETDSKLHSNSHSASLHFASTVSQHVKINLSDSFSRTDDIGTFNGFRAVSPKPEDFHFIFSPVATRILSQINSAGVGVDYAMTEKSTLAVSGTHTLLNYDGTGLSGSLSDQQRATGSIKYLRRTTRKDTWSVGYTGSYFDFKNFHNSFSNAAEVGYSTTIGRDLGIQITTGASQVHDLVSSATYIGFNTSASLQKNVQSNSLSVYFRQSTGDSSGLGSVSDNRQIGFSMNRQGRTATAFADIAAFDTRGRLDNALDARGIQGTVSLGIRLSRTISFQGGVEYQKYDHTTLYPLDQKRGFVSLRYSNPALFRFAR